MARTITKRGALQEIGFSSVDLCHTIHVFDVSILLSLSPKHLQEEMPSNIGCICLTFEHNMEEEGIKVLEEHNTRALMLCKAL